MFGFDDAQNDYNKVQNTDNQAELSHELIAGGASFFAMHEFEKHQEASGEEVSHGFAKEMLAGFAGAGVDYLAETKGADFVDREKAKHEAKQKAEQLYDQHYGQNENYNPRQHKPHHKVKETFG